MKTLIYKMMTIAAVCTLTLPINAQNTKSYSSKNYAEQLMANAGNIHIVSALNEELNTSLMKLAEFTRFNPKKDGLNYKDPEYTESLKSIGNELEKDVKFRPEESLVNEMDKKMAMDETMNELKSQVKYNPSESVVNSEYETSAAFTEILNELAKDVKYHPQISD